MVILALYRRIRFNQKSQTFSVLINELFSIAQKCVSLKCRWNVFFAQNVQFPSFTVKMFFSRNRRQIERQCRVDWTLAIRCFWSSQYNKTDRPVLLVRATRTDQIGVQFFVATVFFFFLLSLSLGRRPRSSQTPRRPTRRIRFGF